MCRPVRCSICGKTTWAGCGAHVDQVKAGVPASEWCDNAHTPDEVAAARQRDPFAGLFGR